MPAREYVLCITYCVCMPQLSSHYCCARVRSGADNSSDHHICVHLLRGISGISLAAETFPPPSLRHSHVACLHTHHSSVYPESTQQQLPRAFAFCHGVDHVCRYDTMQHLVPCKYTYLIYFNFEVFMFYALPPPRARAVAPVLAFRSSYPASPLHTVSRCISKNHTYIHAQHTHLDLISLAVNEKNARPR